MELDLNYGQPGAQPSAQYLTKDLSNVVNLRPPSSSSITLDTLDSGGFKKEVAETLEREIEGQTTGDLPRTVEQVAQCIGSINQYGTTLSDTTGKSQEVYNLIMEFTAAQNEAQKLVVMGKIARAENRIDIAHCVNLVKLYNSSPSLFSSTSASSSTPESSTGNPPDPTECDEGWDWSPEDDACVMYEQTWWQDFWESDEKKYHRWAVYGTGALVGILFVRWVWGKTP